MQLIFHRRLLPAALSFLLMAATAAGIRDAAAANASVTISNFSFTPAGVTVAVGESVTWNHAQQGVPHTVSSDSPGVFESGTMSNGNTFVKTFTAAGTFTYHCNIHSTMTGSVVVTGAAAATNTPPAPTATPPPTATTVPASATATATTAAATTEIASATVSPGTASPTRAASPGATSSAAISPTPAPPQAPDTGDDDDGGGSGVLLILLGVAAIGVAAAVVGYVVLRGRGAA